MTGATGSAAFAADPAETPGSADTQTSGSTSAPAATVTPTDQRYPELVTGNNQRWVAKPDTVQLVTTSAQAVAVVQNAVSAGKRITVRSGGHCYEDFVSNPDVKVILDMSKMNRVYWDSARRAYAVEAGAVLLDMYEQLYKLYGVVVPGGYCYSVGVGGFIAGGGFGLLSRRNGLSVDHLYGVEVVTVDTYGRARLTVATREAGDPNRDLWWAHTGGGGGNFGVVTRYWFRSAGSDGSNPATALPKPPAQVLLSTVTMPWSKLSQADFTKLVDNYGKWYAANSAPDSPYTALGSYLILNHQANGAVSILTQVDATAQGAQSLLDSFLAAVTDGVSATPSPLPAPRTLPWLRATRMLGTSSPVLNNPTLRGDHKSACMRKGFPPEQIATLYKYLNSPDYSNAMANVVLHPYGGKVASVAEADTAAPHRSTVFKVLTQTFWQDAAEDAKHLAWTRAFYGEMYAATGGVPVPNDVTDGCYVNYPDTDISDPAYNTSSAPWHRLYYKDNYPRLQKVKAAWDPKNIFRHGQSVQLP
ncbi:FAD-binding oxidoreductase [Streptomyces melanogenes]|uniref:FAD-binding oxidoreductase n=1 Tax=Streptomyces melanogenes TaxID=67326 RepID=UPI001E2CA6E8|nr:FAD-binding oxidoreductase [Streptomyces melanogenes]